MGRGDAVSYRVEAVVPAYNEAQHILATLVALRSPLLDAIWVVDDASTDSTAEIAERAGARVIRLPKNQGKAAALAAGVEQSTAAAFLFVDADLGPSAGHAIRLLDPLMSGEADMAIASWPPAGKQGGFGIVKRTAAWCIRRTSGYQSTSPLSGQRALRREVWDAFRGAHGYGFELALTIDALCAGYKVMEVALPLTHRHMGRSFHAFVHRGRQLVHIVAAMWPRRSRLL